MWGIGLVTSISHDWSCQRGYLAVTKGAYFYGGRDMHEVAVSLTCLMMILAPCMVALAGRVETDELE